MAGTRLDTILAERGLARSRTHAARLVAEGLVTVDGKPQVKPSFPVRDEQVVEVAATDHYVSRAAHKLIAALDAFAIDPAGRIAIDAGASTGGFSQVLLERNAARVLAVDVGHGQLSSEIQESAQLTSFVGFNIREITREWVAAALQSPEIPTLVVADLSFISLTLVIGPLRDAVAGTADFVLLIKPQFEVGRTKEGVVHSAARRQEAIAAVLWAGWDVGLGTAGLLPSPIIGSAGNHEYLVWLSAAAGTNPTEWRARTAEIA